MRLIANPSFSRRTALRVRAGRVVNSVVSKGLSALRFAWNQAFPMPPLPSPPDPPAPIAKAAALREGALLAEDIEAKSDRRIA
jgi:hypothetical protein